MRLPKIAKNRPKMLKQLLTTHHITRKQAQELGLIDGALYRNQVYDELKNRLGYKAEDELRTVSGSDLQRSYAGIS